MNISLNNSLSERIKAIRQRNIQLKIEVEFWSKDTPDLGIFAKDPYVISVKQNSLERIKKNENLLRKLESKLIFC